MSAESTEATPYYRRHGVTVLAGEALDHLRGMPDASVDAVVCDPPYGLSEIRSADVVEAVSAWCTGDREHIPARLVRGFMGRDWDRFVPPPAVWDECLRVLKPGGHLVAFAGSRTYDLMGLSIRLAGFEVRDGLQWLYSTGFPKSLDVGKAIDKAAGAEREVIGTGPSFGAGSLRNRSRVEMGYRPTELNPEGGAAQITAPATPDAQRWQGWGTALKPAHEPIVLARKPLAGTVAANVLAHGTGALNVDGTRVAAQGRPLIASKSEDSTGILGNGLNGSAHVGTTDQGRWPSNVLLGHGELCGDVCQPGCPVAELDAQSGTRPSGGVVRGSGPSHSGGEGIYSEIGRVPFAGHGDTGGASRFFPTFRWEAKAATTERPQVAGVAHPTVKPVALMRWLVRLVTPPGGTVLDPFAGSGTTGQAARAEGFPAVLVERDPTFLPLIVARLDARPRQAEVNAVADDEPLDLLDLLGDAS